MKGAPVFPNLVQEASLGYDVHIDLPGLPLFFQYKLPELMKRSTATEISVHKLSGFTVPFFRMPIMRRDLSHQHKRLIEWEQKFPGTVFYASPCLHTLSEFNGAYSAGQVHKRSALFSPNAIGLLPDDKDHVVAYRADAATAYFCSEPSEINAMNYDGLSEATRQLFHRPEYASLASVAGQLRSTVRELVSPEMKEVEGVLAQRVQARRSGRVESAPAEAERTIEDVLIAREMAPLTWGSIY